MEAHKDFLLKSKWMVFFYIKKKQKRCKKAQKKESIYKAKRNQTEYNFCGDAFSDLYAHKSDY